MATNVDLFFRVIGQDKTGPALKSAASNISAIEKASDKASKAATAFKGALAGVAVGAAVGAFFKRTISEASDLEQAMGALSAVFGDNTDAMTKNAKAAQRIGLSQSVYAQSAAKLGAQLGNLGVTQDELAGTTDGLMQQAADMAAQFGGTTADAVDALGALFRGERDPIERYGVSITDAGIKAEMAATGLDKTQATMSLLNKQLEKSNTIGAAAREMDTLAGSAGRMQAAMSNAAAQIGGSQLPVMAKLADMVGELAPQLADALTPAFEALGEVALDALEGIEGNLPAIREGIANFGDAMKEIGPTVQRNWPEIKDTIEKVAGALETAGAFTRELWDAFKSLPPEVQEMLALLAVAQKTGVISVAFDTTKLVSGFGLGKFVPVVGAGGAVLGVAAAGAVLTGIALQQLASGQTMTKLEETGGNPMTPAGTYSLMGGQIQQEIANVENLTRAQIEFREETARTHQSLSPGAELVRNAKNGLTAIGDGFKGLWFVAQYSLDAVVRTVGDFGVNVNNLFQGIGRGIRDSVSAAWRIVGTNFTLMRDEAIARIGEMFTGVNNWFQSIGRSIENSVRAAWRIVGTTFTQMKNDVADIFRGMVAQIGSIWDGVTAVVRRPIAELYGWLNRNLVIPINNVLGRFSDSVKLNFFTPPGYADGGWIVGPGGSRDDKIPAMLSNGEHVTPTKQAQANRPVLDAIRAGAVFELPPKAAGVAEQAAAAASQGYGIGGIADVVTDVLARGAGAAVRFFANPALDLATRMFGGEWSPDVVLAGARNIVDNTARWGEAQDAIAAASGSTYTGPRGAIQRPLNSYVVTSEWMRSGADMRHFGIDLGASMGTPVFAAANGRVIPTTGLGWNGGYGNMATIDHGAGLKTLYAHMESLATSVGQLVSAGQRIGTVGSTGSSTGPHLHFETHRAGRPVDPRSVLTFDNGGYLPTGVSTVFNGTSSPEPILTDKQWKSVMDGGSLEAEVVVPLNIDGQQVAEALIRLKRNRGGALLGIA